MRARWTVHAMTTLLVYGWRRGTRSDCDATQAEACAVDAARERVCRDVEHDAKLPRTEGAWGALPSSILCH